MRKYIYRNHILAAKDGRIKESRFVFYEANKEIELFCHWCNMPLIWRVGNEQSKHENSVCVDHLDRNEENNDISNLVPSCRECNANRHKNGRRKPTSCPECGKQFIKRSPKTIYCSVICASKNRPKRLTKTKHGTRSRYMTGCRCKQCVHSNSSYWNEWNKKRNSSINCWNK